MSISSARNEEEETLMSSLVKEINDIRTKLEKLKEDGLKDDQFRILEAELDNSSQMLASVSGKDHTLWTKLHNLQKIVETVGVDLSLRGEINALETRLKNLNIEKQEVGNENTTISGEINKVNSTPKLLQDEIASLNQKLAPLSEKIKQNILEPLGKDDEKQLRDLQIQAGKIRKNLEILEIKVYLLEEVDEIEKNFNKLSDKLRSVNNHIPGELNEKRNILNSIQSGDELQDLESSRKQDDALLFSLRRELEVLQGRVKTLGVKRGPMFYLIVFGWILAFFMVVYIVLGSYIQGKNQELINNHATQTATAGTVTAIAQTSVAGTATAQADAITQTSVAQIASSQTSLPQATESISTATSTPTP